MTPEQAEGKNGKKQMRELAPYFAVVVVGLLMGSLLLKVFKGESSKPGVVWQTFSEAAFLQALAQKKPVMIYFAADWCGPCHKLRQETFTDRDVMAETEKFVRFKVDLTDPKAELAKTGERYAVMALPTVVFIDEKGNERTRLRLIGFEEPARFRKRLEAMK